MKIRVVIRDTGSKEQVEYTWPVRRDFTHIRVGQSLMAISSRQGDELDEGSIALHPELAVELGVSDGMELGYWLKQGELCLGPVVGVFMSKGWLRKLQEQTSNFRIDALVEANKEVACFMYFFTIDSVDWVSRQVQGMIYDHITEIWEKRFFPLPDVLYDRGGGFTRKQRPRADLLRRRLERLKTVHKVNVVYHFSKWEQYQNIMTDRALARHTPHTVKGTLRNLNIMLRRYPRLFVKGFYGSNGLEVMRVDRLPTGGFQYAHAKTGNVVRQAKSRSALWKAIKRFLGDKDFVIQQGIEVIQYNDRNVDMRVLMQRDLRGRWRMTAAPVRIATASAVSSTRSGSEVYTLERALTECFGWGPIRVQYFKRRLHCFSQEVVNAMERTYGRFGELGVDVALDNEGQFWFIEANSKPGKDTVVISGDKEQIRLAFVRPLYYCRYLVGFPTVSG